MEKVLEKTLRNGVKVWSLTVENNFSEAQEIFDLSEYTRNFDVEYAYKRRVSNDFVATYEVKIEREDDYGRFLEMLEEEKDEHRDFYNKENSEIHRQYYAGKIPFDEYYKYSDWLFETYQAFKAQSKKHSMEVSFKEWQTGKTEKGMKLGKALRKNGFSQGLIDFYSLQIKEEKSMYFTVSDLVHHVAGMSNYAKQYSWDGMGGTSCQDTRHDEEYCRKLAGSLHDNKLFIGMLHESMEDLENMEDKLVARTMMRLMHVDNKPCMVATSYYGNNKTKDMLHKALLQLKEVDIFSNEVRTYRGDKSHQMERVYESTNGYYNYTMFEDVHVHVDEWSEVTGDCPCCDGHGTRSVWSEYAQEHVDIDCPMCEGSGTHTEEVHVHIDEWKEVEVEGMVQPYFEGYQHNGYNVVMALNVVEIEKARIQQDMTDEEYAELGMEYK